MASNNLWPLKGGTWRERLLGAVMLAELLWLWTSCYLLAWMMKN